MEIWKNSPTLQQLNDQNSGTIHQSLGIRFVKIGDDFLEATLPADERTQNPIGTLHGGASVVLAESLGSVASILVAGRDSVCFGIEINASHVKAVRSGTVLGRVRPVRLGQTLHVWNIEIFENDQPNAQVICQSRLTVMVRKTQKL